MLDTLNPYTRDEIVRDFRQVDQLAQACWQGFSDDEFFRPLGTGWSPAQNVAHLVKSTDPVSLALRLPSRVLRLLFGRPAAAARNYGQIRQTYQGILAAGGGAGSFTPAPFAATAATPARRAKLMTAARRSADRFAARVLAYTDVDLDRYRLPHPLIGKLTLREMLLFTVYHHGHHLGKVQQRRAAR